MDPIARAALNSWGWRPEVIVFLVVPGVLFLLGWRKLRLISGADKGAGSLGALWRPFAYLSGLLVIGLALMSPVDVLGQQLFFMHMIQHLLLIMVAPVLLLLPNPMPYLLWGLPARARLRAGSALNRVLHKQSITGRLLRQATSPAIVWFSMIVFIIGWHDPNTYDAALRNELIHDLEHVTMFIAGMLFWWTVIGAGPRLNKNMSRPAKIAFVIAAVPPNMALGAALAFSQTPIYSFYVDMPRLWGMSVLDDQRLSGIIMWIPGSMMYLIAALVLMFRILSGDDKKAPRQNESFPSDEMLAASGAVAGGGSGGGGA